MSHKFYLTTTLPYVNAEPHIGFALEIVQADVTARFKRMLGEEIFFNFGTDEHGQKIYEKARESGVETQAYVDSYAAKFDALKSALNLSYNNFIRTTDSHHIMAAEEFWKKCDLAGDIYKKHYGVKYCVGCELEKTDSELEDGYCPIHPKNVIELREEENYFFRFSKYQSRLLALYGERPDFVVPPHRLKEVETFVGGGLQDFSISRLREKMPWGVPVPGDEEHVMYVWFDALVNYVSAIGWPERQDEFLSWWPVVQFAGKDNLRQQAAMWQAMLMSAGIEPSRQIIIHGFINSDGQKMSKSLGNVVNPFDVVKKYGTDALRYYLLREVTPFEDGDFTDEKFLQAYNGNLANGIGNLVSRVMKMSEAYLETPVDIDWDGFSLPEEFVKKIDSYLYNEAMDYIWEKIKLADQIIQSREPFKLIKTDKEAAQEIVRSLVGDISFISFLLTPFLPETAKRIKDVVNRNKIPEPLFARID